MACELCADVIERTDIPHVVKICGGCGRELHVFVPGENGQGLRVEAGERISIPAGWMQMSTNPLEGNMIPTRAGLAPLISMFFLEDLHGQEDAYLERVADAETRMDEIVNAFAPLDGLDINNESDIEPIVEIMRDHAQSRESFAMWSGIFLAVAREAIQKGDALRAAWATACAERFRSMLVFKESLEDVVWMGWSVRRVLEILKTWAAHADDADEAFWQRTFNENAYVLSQVFAIPMVFLQDRAYVGGMTLDRSDSRFVDYLFSAESSREAILIEIKTPCTPLLASEYRGLRPPSRELSGSVLQVQNYSAELTRNLRSLTDGTDYDLNAFTPRCAVIVGNAMRELDSPEARRSFELYRSGLNGVEVVTYDELFRKVEILAELFGLKRQEESG